MASVEWFYQVVSDFAKSIGKVYDEDDKSLEDSMFSSDEWLEYLKERVVADSIEVKLLDHRNHQNWSWDIIIPIEGHWEWDGYCIIQDINFRRSKNQ